MAAAPYRCVHPANEGPLYGTGTVIMDIWAVLLEANFQRPCQSFRHKKCCSQSLSNNICSFGLTFRTSPLPTGVAVYVSQYKHHPKDEIECEGPEVGGGVEVILTVRLCLKRCLNFSGE